MRALKGLLFAALILFALPVAHAGEMPAAKPEVRGSGFLHPRMSSSLRGSPGVQGVLLFHISRQCAVGIVPTAK
jgi:hypothetical protein